MPAAGNFRPRERNGLRLSNRHPTPLIPDGATRQVGESFWKTQSHEEETDE